MAQLASAGDFGKISTGEWVINATDLQPVNNALW